MEDLKDIIFGVLLLFNTCTSIAFIQHLLDIPPYNDKEHKRRHDNDEKRY